MYTRDKRLTGISRDLRKNMTPQERHLWYDYLKNLPITVRRQYNIGKYIVDFYVPTAKLVVELDGSQHYEQENRGSDITRDAALENMGIRVLRYSNKEINEQFDRVCDDIRLHLDL